MQEEIRNYVENSPEYLQALKNYINSSYEKGYSLSFGTNLNKVSFEYDFDSYQLSVPVTFSFSDDFSVSANFSANNDVLTFPVGIDFNVFNFDINLNGNFRFVNDEFKDSYGISISKNLFDNSDEEDLEEKISLLNAKWNLLNVKNQKVIEYLNNAYYSLYYSKMYEIYSKLYQLKKEEFKKVEEKYSKGIISQIEYLNEKKSLLTLQKNLKSYESKKSEYEKYSGFPLSIFEVNLPQKDFGKRLDLKALKVQKQLNELKKERLYQLYVPNINLGFSIDYDYKEGSSDKEFKPKVYLSFTLDLFGNKKLEKENILIDYEIASKNLQEKIDMLENQYEQFLYELENSNNDYEIALIEKKIKEINLEKVKEKFEKGLVTENEYKISEYEYLIEEYNLENVEFSIFIKKLNIYSFLGYDLLSLIEEVLEWKRKLLFFL